MKQFIFLFISCLLVLPIIEFVWYMIHCMYHYYSWFFLSCRFFFLYECLNLFMRCIYVYKSMIYFYNRLILNFHPIFSQNWYHWYNTATPTVLWLIFAWFGFLHTLMFCFWVWISNVDTVFLFVWRFAYFYLKCKFTKRKRKREKETESSIHWFTPPDGYNDWSCANLKLFAARSLIGLQTSKFLC